MRSKSSYNSPCTGVTSKLVKQDNHGNQLADNPSIITSAVTDNFKREA